MTTTTTTNFSFTKPSVGGEINNWGTLLNANWDAVDLLIANILSGAQSATELNSALFTGTGVNGTVAQSGGASTGALFEYGTNANGSYIRLPNSLQICWNAALSASASGAQTWTFPAVFSAAPAPIAVGRASATRIARIDSVVTSNLGFSNYTTAGARTAQSVGLAAIGTWY